VYFLKRKLLISGVAIIILVIGIVGAINSFFANEKIYYISIGLIILSLLILFIIVVNYLIDKFKTATLRGKWVRGALITLFIIIIVIFS
jgi:hypothetical protein